MTEQEEIDAVVRRAAQAMLAQVRYHASWASLFYEIGDRRLPDTDNIPAHLLTDAARRLYIDCLVSEGGVSCETFEWFLDLQHGLLEAA